MKLKSTVQRSVDLAFARFAELVKPATFKKVVGYATDPLTGLNVHVYATAEVGDPPAFSVSRRGWGLDLLRG